MADFSTFRQWGQDLDEALRQQTSGFLLYHPLCGFATGQRQDIPEGWEEMEVPEGGWVSLAASWAAIAVADMAFGRDVYGSALKAGHYGRLALGQALVGR